jgi:spermidine synthase
MDARFAISKLFRENKKFDLILIDCYWIDSEVPQELTTKIFFENVENILEKNWTISINMANFLIDSNKENKERIKKYREIHNNLKNIFWNYFSLLINPNLEWDNAVWIYNLDKYYSSKDFDDNYLEKVEKWEIKYDYNIILNTLVDEGRIFLE